jgi:hypothetical protein
MLDEAALPQFNRFSDAISDPWPKLFEPADMD